MVIASNGRAFGAAEKDVAVKKPLLVQATMPRVVSTDEEVEVPVTVFALEDGVGKVDVKIAANESFSPVGPSSKSITLGRSRRGGRIVPPEGQQANRHREGTGHGCVVGRQLRVGNRAGRPGTEPLCDPVEGLCHRPRARQWR